MLKVRDAICSYGRISAVRSASLDVEQGEIVSLIGANGAGKTTLLRAISGLHKLNAGALEFEGAPLLGASSHDRVRKGIVQVPEGRRVFGSMSVEDNLALGGITVSQRKRQDALAMAFDLFPVLFDRRHSLAGSLSGGEQQMLAIGRALMSKPKLLLLDEPSLGLAPKIIVEIFRLIQMLNAQGTSILLVEQNAIASLHISHRAYIMETGEITREGQASDLQNAPEIKAAFLGDS